MVWLTSRSDWVLVIGCLAVAAAVAVGSTLVALARIRPEERDHAHVIAAPNTHSVTR